MRGRGKMADGCVGGFETIGQPWLFVPEIDALVELLKHVVSDRAAARAIGTAASAHIREHFTWVRTTEAVERRLMALAGSHRGDPWKRGAARGQAPAPVDSALLPISANDDRATTSRAPDRPKAS